jgi:hypothetical protein
MQLRSAARPLLLGLLLAALAAPGGAGAELWRWIDADGVARFTPDPDRVPAARRSTLVPVEAGMLPAPVREPAIAKPLPIFAPPGDPALAQDPWNAPGRAPEVEGQTLRDTREIVVDVPSAEPPSAPPPTPGPPEAAPLRSVPPGPPEAAPFEQAPLEPAPPSLATAARPPSPPSIAPPAPTQPLSRDAEARRTELAAAIARDEEALKAHVSSGDDLTILESPELRAIAERLPALQAELRALEAQSAAP